MEKILFYYVDKEYGCFSNFSKHSIILDGTFWPTVEHYYQARKFSDPNTIIKIQGASSAMDAASIGRSREYQIKENWNEIRLSVMTKAVKAKVEQNNDVRDMLIETGNKEIIEHTTNDDFWGDGGDGNGLNHLGKILMKIREEICDKVYDELTPPWVQYNINVGDLFWRMGVGEQTITDWLVWYRGLAEDEKIAYDKKFPRPKGWW